MPWLPARAQGIRRADFHRPGQFQNPQRHPGACRGRPASHRSGQAPRCQACAKWIPSRAWVETNLSCCWKTSAMRRKAPPPWPSPSRKKSAPISASPSSLRDCLRNATPHRASASPCFAIRKARSTPCSSRPIWRSTRPRMPGATRCASSIPPCRPVSKRALPWSEPCARAWNNANSSSTTSPWSTRRVNASGQKPCCAGCRPMENPFLPTSSFRWRKKPDSFFPSEAGC